MNGSQSSGEKGQQTLVEVVDHLIEQAQDARERRALLVLRSYWVALQTHDASKLRPFYSEGVTVELPFSESGRVEDGYFRSFRGIDDVMKFWTTAWTMEADSRGLRDVEVTVSSDARVVFVEGFGQVTMSDGHDYRNRYVFRVTIDDGDLVTNVREYYNPITAARAFHRQIAGESD